MTPTLHIALLGDFRLDYDDGPVTTVNTPRLQSLLAYLALRHDAPQSRQHLAYLLWPDSTEAQARTNLRKHIHHLRRALPEPDCFLHADMKTLGWQPEAPFTLDATEFEHALDQAEHAQDPPAQRAFLEQAVALYRGDLLPSCYDDWVLQERERLRQTYTQALEKLLACLQTQRIYPAAIQHAQTLLQHDPLHETAYRRLMRLYALDGNRAAALRTYHTCATVLQQELGVPPGAATQELHAQLLQVEPLSGPAMYAPVALPLVGRQREWQALQALWRKAARGEAHCALIRGEAGIGKTRLAEEVLSWARRQGITTAASACYAAEGQLPYAPVADWLRSEGLRGRLPALEAKWRTECARLLPELLAQQPDLPAPGPLTEAWQRQHLFTALAQAVLSAAQPMFLLIDDLQWCDQDTLAWLHFLLRYGEHARLLLLCTVRAGEMACSEHPLQAWLGQLRRGDSLTEIALGRLDAQETLDLAAHTRGQPLDPGRAAALYQETEGHPLFIVEMARANLPSPGASLPDKIKAVIEVRLSQLSPLARELAGIAAVLGRSFTFDLLAAVSDYDDDARLRALDELWQRRIVRERGSDAYDFSHDKIRQAAYEALNPARRHWWHKRVIQALQTADDLDAVQGQLAAHCEAVGQVQPAIEHYQRAAEVSQRIFAHQETIQYLQRAIALLAKDTTVSEQATMLHEQLGDVLVRAGEHKSAQDAFARAVTHTRDPVQQARLLEREASTLQSQHRYEEAGQVYQAALKTLGEQLGAADPTWRQTWIALQFGMLNLFYHRDRLPAMMELLDALQAPLKEYGTARQRANYFNKMTMADMRRTRFRPTQADLANVQQAFAWGRKTGDQGLIASQQFGLGFSLLWSGDVDAALKQLSLALAEAERMGHISLQDRCLAYLAISHRFKGSTEQVRAFTEQGLAVAQAEQDKYYQGVAHANRAWLCYREQDFEGAVANGQTALVWWGSKPYPFQWLALFPLLAVALARDEIEQAVNHAAALLALQQQRLPGELTQALERAIHADGPHPHLQQALQLAQEMGYL